MVSQGLRYCAAFGGSDHCSQCSHHWQEHLHVLYELTEETVTIPDAMIERELRNNANDVTLRETALKQLEQRIAEYEKERQTIREATADFGIFLRNSSLVPYNDALIAYLDSLIKQEQMKVQANQSDKRLLSLMEDRNKYEEAISLIMKDMGSNASRSCLDEISIDGMVEKLYGLKHFGGNLKDLKQKITAAHQATYREIPHTIRRKNYPRNHSQKQPSPPHQNSAQVNSQQAATKSSNLFMTAVRKFNHKFSSF